MMTIKKVWVDDTAVYANKNTQIIIFIIFIKLIYNIRIQIQLQRWREFPSHPLLSSQFKTLLYSLFHIFSNTISTHQTKHKLTLKVPLSLH